MNSSEDQQYNPNLAPQDFWGLVKHIYRLALPMAGSRLIQMLSSFIGILMLAHLGHQVLAASALITSTQVTVIVVIISVLFALGVVTGQAYGGNRRYEIGAIVQQGCVLAILLTIPLMLVLWYASDLLLWSGQIPALVDYVRQYLHALEWGAIAFTLQSALQQVCYGMSKQRLVIIVNFLGLLVFVPVAYVLIYGKLGFPELGVVGLAYATSFQAWFILLLLLLSLYLIKDFKGLHLFTWRNHKGWHHLRQLFSIGWPMCVQFGGELISFFVRSVMVGWLGVSALAAWQVNQQVLFLFFVPMFAVAEATGILVSQSVGANRSHEAKRIGNMCILLSLGTVLVLTTLFFIFPRELASLYIKTNDPSSLKTMHLTVLLFIATGFLFIVDTLRQIITGALRGLYDTRFAMWVGVVVSWAISVTVGYWFTFPLGWGVIGMRVSGILAFLLGSICVYWRWSHK